MGNGRVARFDHPSFMASYMMCTSYFIEYIYYMIIITVNAIEGKSCIEEEDNGLHLLYNICAILFLICGNCM